MKTVLAFRARYPTRRPTRRTADGLPVLSAAFSFASLSWRRRSGRSREDRARTTEATRSAPAPAPCPGSLRHRLGGVDTLVPSAPCRSRGRWPFA